MGNQQQLTGRAAWLLTRWQPLLASNLNPCLPPPCHPSVHAFAANSFSRDQLSLIDRGWTVAIAHIRGGGDMGRRWYEVRAGGGGEEETLAG